MSSGQQNKDTVRISEKKQAGLTAVATPLTGKCSYPACQHNEDEETNQYITVKNTDYKFHSDCFDQWTQENRGMGRFKQEDKVKALDEQSGKAAKETKESKK